MTEKLQVGGVTYSDELVLISVLAMPSKPGTAGTIMSAMGENNLNLEFIVQTIGLSGKDHIVFCVNKKYADEVMAVVNRLKRTVHAKKVARRDNVGIVFVFGPDFQFVSGIAGDAFKTLGKIGINIIAISTSVSTLSCVIEAERLAEAVAALEERFVTP
ncbi:MAG: ACT domain-containing protein [Anaerolineae bacterium]